MTKREFTFEILGGYLMNDNRVNVEYLAHCVEVVCENERRNYDEMLNRRRKARSVSIEWLRDFINGELGFAGYKGYTATNAQLIAFDRKHGGGLERVLDKVTAHINARRAEV